MHSLHVGYVGIMGNLHYIEMVDFLLGILGWDVRGDDKATWLAKQEKERATQQAAIASLPDDFSTPASPAPTHAARTPRSAPAPAPGKAAGTRSPPADTTRLDWRP